MRNSNETIGFGMEFMRFSVRSLSKTIGFYIGAPEAQFEKLQEHH